MILIESRTFVCVSKRRVIDSRFERVEMTYTNRLKAVCLFLRGRADLIIAGPPHARPDQ